MIDSLSQICFGCEALGGTDWGDVSVENVEAAISASVELGLNFFDTAGVYGLGLSEERLARILAKRHSLIIATKGGLIWESTKKDERAVIKNSSKAALNKNVLDSLKRLKLDVLPIFYVHWPDESVSFQETFDALNEIKHKGLIDSIGVSNFSMPQLELASDLAPIEFAQISANILDVSQIISIGDFCSAKKIKIITYNVLCSGLLMGKFKGTEKFPVNDRRSRLPLFQGEVFSKTVKNVEELRIKAAAENLSVGFYSVKKLLEDYPVYSAIIGIKTEEQIKNFEKLIKC